MAAVEGRGRLSGRVQTHRANYFAEAPKVAHAMLQLSAFVNGIGLEKPLQAMTLEIRDGAIVALYVMRNPDKLAHLAPLLQARQRPVAADCDH